MAKEPKTLDDLFHDTLKDIYFAEKKILATLPKMAKAAQSEELKAAFEKHRTETEGQIERLEKVFAVIEQKPQGKTCAAINGSRKRVPRSWKNKGFAGTGRRPPCRRAGRRALRDFPLRHADRLGRRARPRRRGLAP